MNAAGFIGVAPDPYEARWDDSELLPIVLYEHGDLSRFPVRFAEADEIQLADFYANEDCESWTHADLRTGEMHERPCAKRQGSPGPA